MTGVVITSHGPLCSAVIKSAEMIAGPQEQIWSVSLDESGVELFEERLNATLDEAVSQCVDVIILADISNATPFNCSYKYLLKHAEDGHIYLLSGFNLPLVAELLFGRDSGDDTEELVHSLVETGAEAVQMAQTDFTADEDEDF